MNSNSDYISHCNILKRRYFPLHNSNFSIISCANNVIISCSYSIDLNINIPLYLEVNAHHVSPYTMVENVHAKTPDQDIIKQRSKAFSWPINFNGNVPLQLIR